MSASPVPLPPALRGAPFSTRTAAAAGVSPGRLRAQDLAAPHRGVRVPGTVPDGLAERCCALLPVLPAGARFSHATALALLDVELPWQAVVDERLYVEVSTSGTRPRIRGVVAHRQTGRAPVLDVRGLPVLDPACAWTRLAATLEIADLVVVADALCRRRQPVSSPEQLGLAVAALPPGTRGVRRLRAALAATRPGTDSCMETRTRLALEGAGIVCDVNRPVDDAHGRFVAMPDLSDHRLRVAVEYDGDVHRTDRRTWRRDVARKQALEAVGWRVVTVTADDLRPGETRWLRWVATARTSQAALLAERAADVPSAPREGTSSARSAASNPGGG